MTEKTDLIYGLLWDKDSLILLPGSYPHIEVDDPDPDSEDNEEAERSIHPGTYTLDLVDDELLNELCHHAGATEEQAMMDDPWFRIPIEQEQQMLAVVRSAGYSIRRDDTYLTHWT